MRTSAEGTWRPRLVALTTALAGHAVIVAVLMSNANSGIPAIWQPQAHATHLALPQEIVADVSMPISSNLDPVRGPSTPSNVVVRHTAPQRPRPINLSDVEALTLDPDPAVATEPLVPISGVVPIRCEVHFHQDVHGAVQAIDFGLCTGDQFWQQNLLEQLQQAARLIRSTEGTVVPPVRTMVIESDSISPEKLAAQLMETVVPSSESRDR
jgi:hypothetical protein